MTPEALTQALARWMFDGDFEVWVNDHRDANRRMTPAKLAAELGPYLGVAGEPVTAMCPACGHPSHAEPQCAERGVNWRCGCSMSETAALQEFAARYGIPLPEGLHIDSDLVGPKRRKR